MARGAQAQWSPPWPRRPGAVASVVEAGEAQRCQAEGGDAGSGLGLRGGGCPRAASLSLRAGGASGAGLGRAVPQEASEEREGPRGREQACGSRAKGGGLQEMLVVRLAASGQRLVPLLPPPPLLLQRVTRWLRPPAAWG